VNRLTRDEIPLLVGTMDFSDGPQGRELHNSSLLFDGSLEAVGTYHKQHLVPFGEYVPFPNLFRSMSPLDVDFTAGEASTLFRLPEKAPFSVLICFEDTMGALARRAVQGGARWLINQTNDAWFDPSFQSEQHLAHAIFRCVENRVPMVRSCNTGVTSIIDSFGRVNRRLEPQTSGFLVGTVHPALQEQKQTHYTRWGDRFAQAMGVAGGVALLLLGWRVRKLRI
jgi:apolipoprotein N-acyltransferase